jgi:hypothetical protein
VEVDDVVVARLQEEGLGIEADRVEAAKKSRTLSIPCLVRTGDGGRDGPLDLLGQGGGDAVAVIGGVRGEESLDGGELGSRTPQISR